MNRLAWLILPLLFLPNLGLSVATQFGILKPADYIIVPYLAVVTVTLLQVRRRRSPKRHYNLVLARQVATFFLAWVLLSTLTEGLRFGYSGSFEITFSLLKLGKLSLYLLAGLLTIQMIRETRDVNRLLWALSVGGAATALTLPFTTTSAQHPSNDPLRGFLQLNAASVEIAIIIMFLSAAWACRWGGLRWRKVAPYLLGAMTLCFAFSQGRGGWLAALVGILWFLVRRGVKLRTLAITAILGGVVFMSFQRIPMFRYDVLRSLDANLDPAGSDPTFMGLDAAGRPTYWAREGAKLLDSPALGRGLFNRFPASGLDWVGSHSFWIQMFLETGIPGGIAILSMLWLLWREARRRGLLPVEVALVVAFIGGLSGEYFYGGMPLFALILCAGLPAASANLEPVRSTTASLLKKPGRSARVSSRLVGQGDRRSIPHPRRSPTRAG